MKLAIVLLAALFIGAIAVSGCTSQSQQPLVEPTTHTTTEEQAQDWFAEAEVADKVREAEKILNQEAQR